MLATDGIHKAMTTSMYPSAGLSRIRLSCALHKPTKEADDEACVCQPAPGNLQSLDSAQLELEVRRMASAGLDMIVCSAEALEEAEAQACASLPAHGA
jgi:hypothetical protein